MGDAIRLFSTLAVQAAVEALLPRFTEEEVVAVDAVFDPTALLQQRMADGDVPDVLIGVSAVLEKLVSSANLLAERPTVLARAGVGIAVPQGTVHPAIATVDDLVATLRGARSVAYSRNGASGIYLAGLLRELGIADQVNARATVVDAGFTALALLDGRADLAVQMISELMFVREVEVVGPLPTRVQHYTEFSATTFGHPAVRTSARRLVEFLVGPAARESYLEGGLQLPPWMPTE